jgi:hypothetical protein
MPNISGLDKTQMQASTANQIRQPMKAYIDALNKHQLIAFNLDKDADDDDPITEYLGVNGQISKMKIVTRDIENVKLSSIVVTWDYYPTGEVDTIIMRSLDAGDVEKTVIKIKHYLDGRPPKVVA